MLRAVRSDLFKSGTENSTLWEERLFETAAGLRQDRYSGLAAQMWAFRCHTYYVRQTHFQK